MFLEISQNSLENTCARVSVLIKLQALGIKKISSVFLLCGIKRHWWNIFYFLEMEANIYACIYVYIYIYIFLYVYTYINIYRYVWYINICIYIYIWWSNSAYLTIIYKSLFQFIYTSYIFMIIYYIYIII